MNTKILKLAQSLYKNEDCKNQKFSLTLNYEKAIDREYIWETIPGTTCTRTVEIIFPILNEEGMKRIEDELSKRKVENFNFTLQYERGKDTEVENYNVDWYTCNLIFHGKKKIEVAFDMLCSYARLEDGNFNRLVGKTNIKEEQFDEVVQKMVDLKNILVESADKTITKLFEIKQLKNRKN